MTANGLRPVSYVSFYDSMRFVNWLHNGQGSGGTETGAYTISTGAITQRARTANVATLTTSTPHTLSVGDQVTVTRIIGDASFLGSFTVTAVTATTFSYANNGADQSATASGGRLTGASAAHTEEAVFWIPTEDEWYKAAYYQPAGAGGPSDSYWLYPTRSDTVPAGNTIGEANSANFNDGDYARDQNGLLTYTTDGGAYGINSASYYGTFDQGGGVSEWNEAIGNSSSRAWRGGNWLDGENPMRSTHRISNLNTSEYSTLGFRVASAVPEPSAAVLMILGGASFLARRARKCTP